MGFEDFVDKVVKYYTGKVTVVLFGSRARGDHWESSDYDIMVFLERVEDPVGEATRLYSMKRGFSADILVLSADKVKEPVVVKMLEHKKVIYDGLNIFDD
ncbi:nucleotidyltransferase domain-containing protein [Stygiolobus caldivivus]|uniref:DNA polymerase subunit beta n=1 Tax=Stygiolobus caldivivus TaxID=2824673 RepID=A0A8D5U7F6_9CREN|nr:nucleotidyltransferase domain-containing protein [Stygiolobus caldivivus]BCU71125.1 DNA polymerase subunit beta [Stygiolobus caldivivus]